MMLAIILLIVVYFLYLVLFFVSINVHFKHQFLAVLELFCVFSGMCFDTHAKSLQ